MRYYIISDIHSYFDEMIESLKKAGYEKKNKQHHLIVIGDLFDRGPKTREVLEYLYQLHLDGQCSIVLGNHDIFLLELVEKLYDKTKFNIKHNGHGETLRHLSGIEPTDDNLEEVRRKVIKDYPYLYDFISSFPLFLEINDYIFVHGGIDGSNQSWRTTTTRRDFVWNKERLLPRIPNKTVVCGHTRVATIREESKDYKKVFKRDKSLFDIMKLEGKIMIDRYVEISKELNVLILDL